MVWSMHLCSGNMERGCTEVLARWDSRSCASTTWSMASKHTVSKSKSRACIYLRWQKEYSGGKECGWERSPHGATRCDSKVHSRCLHETWILHSRAHSMVRDEATYLAPWYQWGHHAARTSDAPKGDTIYLGSRVCMAWRDATSIESMHEDRSAGTSKNYHYVRAGGPQRHYSILSHSGQYLG